MLLLALVIIYGGGGWRIPVLNLIQIATRVERGVTTFRDRIPVNRRSPPENAAKPDNT